MLYAKADQRGALKKKVFAALGHLSSFGDTI